MTPREHYKAAEQLLALTADGGEVITLLKASRLPEAKQVQVLSHLTAVAQVHCDVVAVSARAGGERVVGVDYDFVMVAFWVIPAPDARNLSHPTWSQGSNPHMEHDQFEIPDDPSELAVRIAGVATAKPGFVLSSEELLEEHQPLLEDEMRGMPVVHLTFSQLSGGDQDDVIEVTLPSFIIPMLVSELASALMVSSMLAAREGGWTADDVTEAASHMLVHRMAQMAGDLDLDLGDLPQVLGLEEDE